MNVYRMLTYEGLRTFVAPWVALSLRATSEGTENVPEEGGCLLVSNQRSIWDPFLIMNEVDRFIYFLPGSRSALIPVARTLFRMVENVRPREGFTLEGKGSGVIERAVKRLKDGEVVCVFPEAIESLMRQDSSAGVSYFRTDFALMALKASVPIVPIAIITRKGGKNGGLSASPAEIVRIMQEKGIELSRVVPEGKVHIRVGRPIELGGYLDEPPTRKAVETISSKIRRIIIKLHSGADLRRFLIGEVPFDIYTDRV